MAERRLRTKYVMRALLNWKRYVVVVFIAMTAALFVQTQRVIFYQDKSEAAEARVATLQTGLDDANAKIKAYDDAEKEFRANQEKAEAVRQRRIAELNAQINKLRSQEPPKECAAAIDWAIEKKGDLSW